MELGKYLELAIGKRLYDVKLAINIKLWTSRVIFVSNFNAYEEEMQL